MGHLARLAVLAALSCAAGTMGQTCEPRWSGAFGAGDPVSLVRSAVVFDGGSGPALYVGGAHGVSVWDGAAWRSLNFGASDYYGVYVLTVFDDDGAGPHAPALYAGGRFTSAGSVPAKNVAKWDGAAWSEVGLGVGDPDQGDWVQTLCVYDDGAGPRLYAGGKFLYSGSTLTSLVARWDGLTWEGVSGGLVGIAAQSMAVFDPDGAGPGRARLYIGGLFGEANGFPARNIVGWDGTAFSQLQSGVGGNQDHVFAMAAWNNGDGEKLYVGGQFVRAGAVSVRNLARWDGQVWDDVPGSGTYGIQGDVAATAVIDEDGAGPEAASLFVGGTFDAAGSVQAKGIVKIAGSAWSALGSGFPTMPVQQSVGAIATFDEPAGRSVIAGGDFITAGGVPVNDVARWRGGGWSAVAQERHGLVGGMHSAAVLDAGTGPGLFVGPVIAAGAAVQRGSARWDGTAWQAIPGASGYGEDYSAFVVYDDGTGPAVFAGGTWYFEGSNALLIKWTGSGWVGVPGAPGGTNSAIRALAIFDEDGPGPGRPALYVGGRFDTVNNFATASNMARWNGSSWSNMAGGVAATGMTDGVYALSVHDDGGGPALYVGGAFTGAGGEPAMNVGKWRSGAWQSVPDVAEPIGAMASFADTSGSFLYATLLGSVVRLEPSGWNRVGGPLGGTPRALAVFDDDGAGAGAPALYLGGSLPALNHLARWTGSAWVPATLGTDGSVLGLAVWPAAGASPASLFAVGAFQSAGGVSSGGVAQLIGCSACYANCDGSVTPPVLNVNDFICFQQRFAAGAAYANCDGSTIPPVLNVNDFICFQQRFAGGCR